MRLGGLWLADTNSGRRGRLGTRRLDQQQALFIGLNIDAEKLVDWKGASFGFQFLQFNGGETNEQAGSIAGYNSIVGLPPLNRTELLEAWYLQEMIKDVLSMRIGRSMPTYDFGNVLRPVALADASQNIPAVSGLLWTPIFVNGSMIGAMLGYYNPAQRRDRQFHADQVLLRQSRRLRRQSRARHPDRHQPADVQRLLVQHRRDRRQLGARRGQPSRASSASACGADRHPVPAASPRTAPAASTCSVRSAWPRRQPRASHNSSISVFYQFGANASADAADHAVLRRAASPASA